MSNTALILLLWVKVPFLPKKALALKGIFPETTYVLYLRTKFQVSSIILTSLIQGRGNFTSQPGKITPQHPISKQTAKKTTKISVKVPINLPATTDFPSLSTEYISILSSYNHDFVNLL